jgi:hypothetical protein
MVRTTRATMFMRFVVAVYHPWHKAYEEFSSCHDRMGILTHCIYQASENPLDVTIVYEFENATKAHQFAECVELRTAMNDAGLLRSEIWVTHQVGCVGREPIPHSRS